MPWVGTVENQRLEFVLLASCKGANVRELCRRYRISAQAAYKWLGRYKDEGPAGLADRCRRPTSSPGKTSEEVEAAVLSLRERHPAWGGRKLAKLLGEGAPSPSTITEILRRGGVLNGPGAGEARDWQRFEAERPNDLWQMDYKGPFAMYEGRCHPFDAIDDHSRMLLQLTACGNETALTVKGCLTTAFRTYGMPFRILADNACAWRSGQGLSPIAVWLMRLGIGLSHGRPWHPQTQGKLERFHKTLKAELITGKTYKNLKAAQGAFDEWRTDYNLLRPHESLADEVPASMYKLSSRRFPEILPPIQYEAPDEVRKVQQNGHLHYKGCVYEVSKSLIGYPVGIRPTQTDGVFEVRFMNLVVKRLDLRQNLEGTTCQ